MPFAYIAIAGAVVLVGAPIAVWFSLGGDLKSLVKEITKDKS